MFEYSRTYIKETVLLLSDIHDHQTSTIEKIVYGLRDLRDRQGRLFVLGIGGCAGPATHAVSDFRKICEIESYTPMDNVSELTARISEEGWETSLSEWLKISKFSARDALFIFSVGDDSKEENISLNMVRAIELAKNVGARIFGVTGNDGGFTSKFATACVVVPASFKERIKSHTGGISAIVCHLLVSHPLLQLRPSKPASGAFHSPLRSSLTSPLYSSEDGRYDKETSTQ